MYDIIVIGAGPAGLTAALYALRADKSVLIIERECFGGQITHSPKVENYPGYMEMSGTEFADKLFEQVSGHGAQIEVETVTGIRIEGSRRFVVCGELEYEAKAVIIATGSKHRRLGLEREEELTGEGVSYCAVCDGAFYAGRQVALIGGGNTALQEAIMLSDICKKVTIVQNLEFFTGEQRLVNKLKKRENVEFIMGTVVDELIGEQQLEAIRLKNETTGEKNVITVDGIFVAVGQIPENEPFSELIPLNEYGYFDVGECCETAVKGVYTAGDCRSKRVRQVTTAAADGTVAALAAVRYIDS